MHRRSASIGARRNRLLALRESSAIRFASAVPVDRALWGVPVRSRVWYRATVCDSWICPRDLSIISTHFVDALDAAGWPDGACLFMNATAIFFSPAAVASVPHLIVVSRAEPSPPPDRGGATLVVGRETDWDLLPHPIH